jgi:hypothetical protein
VLPNSAERIGPSKLHLFAKSGNRKSPISDPARKTLIIVLSPLKQDAAIDEGRQIDSIDEYSQKSSTDEPRNPLNLMLENVSNWGSIWLRH